MSQNLSSAAVLVGALRVKIQNLQTIKSQTYFAKIKYNKQGLLFVPTSYFYYILTSTGFPAFLVFPSFPTFS